VISNEELSEIFSNVEDIVHAAQNLVVKLDAFVDEHLHTSQETVGKVFIDEVRFVSSFTPYNTSI
jgi:hypothetical protein